MPDLRSFLNELPQGVEKVNGDDYLENSLGITREVLAGVRPLTRNLVPDILEAATRNEIKIATISTGKNWGYGSAHGSTEPAVILDLSKLGNIKHNADEETISLEPGVTQQNLYDFLQANRLEYLVPTTGAGPDVSVVGNALERGYGITPLHEHFEAVVRLEAWLADGTRFRPAMMDVCGKAIWRGDLGPYLQGLFAQSSLGVVTELTLRLIPKPQVSGFYMAESADFEALLGFLKELRGCGCFNASNLMNGLRMAGMAQSGHVSDKWTAAGSFYCAHRQLRGNKALIQQTARKFHLRVRVFDTPWFSKFGGVVKFLKPQAFSQLKLMFDLIQGKPTTYALNLMGGKTDINQKGLIWYSPMLVCRAEKIKSMIEVIESTCQKTGIKPLITCTLVTASLVDMTVPIIFDKKTQSNQAWECYDRMFEAGKKLGCIPYRYPVNRMQVMQNTVANDVHARIKKALDPGGLFVSSRYLQVDRGFNEQAQRPGLPGNAAR